MMCDDNWIYMNEWYGTATARRFYNLKLELLKLADHIYYIHVGDDIKAECILKHKGFLKITVNIDNL